MKVFLIILLSSFQLYSAEPVTKGDVVPYNGVIFTSKEGRELAKNDKTRLKLKDLAVKQEQRIEIQDMRIVQLRGYVEDQDNLSPMGKLGWGIVGFIGGGIVFYYAGKVVNNVSK